MNKIPVKKIKGAVFDLDGTLLDSMPVWDEIYAAPFREYGIDVPDGYLLKVNHMGLDDCVRYTLSCTPLPCNEEQLISVWHERASKAYAQSVSLKEGAAELIDALRSEGIRLAVATALPYSLFIPCLKRLKIYDAFDFFSSTDDVKHGKDSPEVYLSAARGLGLEPGECLAAEDSHVGIASAKRAGFFTLGVYDAASADRKDEIEKYADVFVFKLTDLMSMIK